MKIYTKTGDEGETGLLGGARVPKSHLAIKVCGALDETNSWVGLVRSDPLTDWIESALAEVQHDLFEIGSRVADCLGDRRTGRDRASEQLKGQTERLEAWIDQVQEKLTPLKVFILPSGSRTGSLIHLARSVCRRSERELVALIRSDIGPSLSDELKYLNRLGDFLFVLARWVNAEKGSLETEWQSNRHE